MGNSGWLDWLRGKSETSSSLNDIGRLVLRVSAGLFMIMGHGWDKLMNFSAKAEVFPDPLGIGSGLTLGIAVMGEFFGALFLMLGFLTRLSLIPLILTMMVAAFIFHATDPFGGKELALLYLTTYIGLFITGPGRHSLDAKMNGW